MCKNEINKSSKINKQVFNFLSPCAEFSKICEIRTSLQIVPCEYYYIINIGENYVGMLFVSFIQSIMTSHLILLVLQ